MVDPRVVTQQLRAVGCNYMLWGRSEINELSDILMDDEQIKQAINGYYDGGFALLCATNYRVLIIDKKPLTLTVEDLRYDMIAEVDYSSRFVTSVLHVYTPMRTVMFTSWSMLKLKTSMNYIQQRVMELRNNDFLASQFNSRQAESATTGTSLTSQSAALAMQSVRRLLPHADKHRAVPMQPTYRQAPATVAGIETAPQNVYVPHHNPIMNPYTKVPLLSRRRKYPTFY